MNRNDFFESAMKKVFMSVHVSSVLSFTARFKLVSILTHLLLIYKFTPICFYLENFLYNIQQKKKPSPKERFP